jgi:hypothetical protein
MLDAGTRETQSADHEKNDRKKTLLSTCSSPLGPHPSTGHVHGCLGSEIGRDPVLPTRFDRRSRSSHPILYRYSLEVAVDNEKEEVSNKME